MKLLLLHSFLLLYFFSFAQSNLDNASQLQLQIKKATGKIIIDRVLDEPDWQSATTAGNFKQNFPADTSIANKQTEGSCLIRIMTV